LTLGSNQIFGATGSDTTGAVDRDYFVITVPTGFELSSITVLPGTVSGGSLSFIGVEAGPQVTVSPNAASAAGLLDWWHYSPADINTDILPSMGIPADGSSGVTPPLGPGQYSFWIQELSTGAFPYGFDLGLTSSVPEPGSLALMVIGLVVGVPVLRRHRIV
jgi:PEP-CTERM motif